MFRRSQVTVFIVFAALLIAASPLSALAQGPVRQEVPKALDGGTAADSAKPVDDEPSIYDVVPAARVPQFGNDYAMQSEGDYPYCLRVSTGVVRTTWRIENPAGLGSIEPAQYANYEQRVLSQGSTFVELELTSYADIDTRAPYPVNVGALTGDIVQYLEPETMAQSNDPAIIALANDLVAGAESQAQAVEQVLAWVASQIAYDHTLTLPNDALSVLEQRAGVCSGYSWLSVALLRAAGVPARYTVGCVGWYNDLGTLHAWIEVYYPDVGWVLSEPQESANHLHTPGYVIGLVGMCSAPGTTVTLLSKDDGLSTVATLETPYTSSMPTLMFAASVPSVERVTLDVSPATVALDALTTRQNGEIVINVANHACQNDDWVAKHNVDWLQPAAIQGLQAGEATFALDIEHLAPGEYSAQIAVYPSMYGVGEPTYVGMSIVVPSSAAFQQAKLDADGDTLTDLFVWRPSTRNWYGALSSTDYSASDGMVQVRLGEDTDIPLLGDIDQDGLTDLIMWDTQTGYWRGSLSSADYAADYQVQWGMSGDTPITGDIDGDGFADLLVWRPSTGTWYALLSSRSYDKSYAQRWTRQWGMTGDLPMLSDLDGDGQDDLVVWRPSTGYWYGLLSSQGYARGSGQYFRLQWGAASDIPLVGDIDGDGMADPFVWRPSNGYWYGLLSTRQYDRTASGRFTRQWGTAGDIPVVHNLDGDGRADIAVWRPDTGMWYGLLSSRAYSSDFSDRLARQWGMIGDKAVH